MRDSRIEKLSNTPISIKNSTELELEKERLLAKFFTCSREEEDEYLFLLSSISKTIALDISEMEEKKLRQQYMNNRDAMRGFKILESVLGHLILFFAAIIGLGLILGGAIVLAVTGWFILGGIFLGLGLFFVLGAIFLRVNDVYKESETNNSYEVEYPLDKKLSILVGSNQFDIIDCNNCHFNNYNNSRIIHSVNTAINNTNKTAFHLPALNQIFLDPAEEFTDYETKLLHQERISLKEKSKKNELRNKYRLFFHENSFLLPELRVILFELLKCLYFPKVFFLFDKNLNSDLTKSF
ncbi:MAG: hypothetical protein H0U73_12540 [Tatlockia sp.]|nr:hypothetical protein [Tatlockia sp.]